MTIDINPRGNGACPLCKQNKACRIKKALKATSRDFCDHDDSPMELVVYSCPYFAEKN